MQKPHPTPKADPIISDLTALFCEIDDYCQQAKSKIEARTLSAPGHRKGRPSEVRAGASSDVKKATVPHWATL